MDKFTSKDVAQCAIKLSLTSDREAEKEYIMSLSQKGIKGVAVDFGGEFIPSIKKIIECAVVASKRQGIIEDTHIEEGAVVGATREAVNQIMQKAIGLNVGGKIAICRAEEHICVCIFFTIGFLNLNEVSIGLGHRVV